MPPLTPADLDALREKNRAIARPARSVRVCASTCCASAGSVALAEELANKVKAAGQDVEVRKVGCMGFCYAAPVVEVEADGHDLGRYGPIETSDAQEKLIHDHVCHHRHVEELALPRTSPPPDSDDGIGPSGKQFRLVTRNCGIIDPTNLDHAIGRGGYQGLRRALEMGREAVIEELKKSGLRGRGGAGFPTAVKWELTAKQNAEQKYMICNGDEGDPGAYMDRSVLEGDPHAVMEGMLIGAFAIGASQGFFYIRAEYPLAVERIENAIKQAKRVGLLGKNILGSSFSCDLEVRLGAGAFVCGEETALIASIEGRRGTPTPRPPYPAVKGLWGAPTNINNVETLASIAPILTRGGEWYSQLGIGKSKGTKVFALTGKVKYPGLIEVPMGITLGEIVLEIGGGTASGRPVKGVQTGGPSGGIIPAAFFDRPVTYESLNELGSIMGSGGMIVLEDTDSMVDVARFYIEFNVEESCGKCAPCRIGTKHIMMLLDKILAKQATEADLTTLRQLCVAVQKASLCGLGQSAPNPILSTLRYFEEEYRSLLVAEPALAAR